LVAVSVGIGQSPKPEFYEIFILMWVILIFLLLLSLVFIGKVLKYLAFGVVALVLYLLLTKRIGVLATPAETFLSFFILFAVIFVSILFGAGILFALLLSSPVFHFTNSIELTTLTAILGFILGVIVTYLIFSRVILPFSLGFSVSLVAAYLANSVTGFLLSESGQSLPDFRVVSVALVGGFKYAEFISALKEFLGQLAHQHTLIFVGSVIVGIVSVIISNYPAKEKKERSGLQNVR
jgi:hypothetical protein